MWSNKKSSANRYTEPFFYGLKPKCSQRADAEVVVDGASVFFISSSIGSL